MYSPKNVLHSKVNASIPADPGHQNLLKKVLHYVQRQTHQLLTYPTYARSSQKMSIPMPQSSFSTILDK